MSLPPCLPSFTHLPWSIFMSGLAGYFCGKVSQVNPDLTAAIFAIRTLTYTLFYHITNYVLRGKDLQSQKIFFISSTLVNWTFLIVLRELNLIGRLFSCLIGLVFIGHLISRVSYIQDQERQLILKKIHAIQ